MLENEDLSEDQIEQLLCEAEGRLRAAENASDSIIELTSERKPLPRLRNDTQTLAYIQERDGVARANPAMLVDKAQKDSAQNWRVVEDVRAPKKVVRPTLLSPRLFFA